MERARPLIAIVDDEEPVRRALERVLRAASLRTATFACAERFLAQLEELQADCALLDLHMPGLDGFETQRRLAAERPDLPVVVLTAHDEPAVRERAMRSGAAAFLSKPVESQRLVDAILRAVARAAGCAEETWDGPANGGGEPGFA
jgi:two-component system, LuxR family, response regulator FixJ